MKNAIVPIAWMISEGIENMKVIKRFKCGCAFVQSGDKLQLKPCKQHKADLENTSDEEFKAAAEMLDAVLGEMKGRKGDQS